MIIFHVNVFDIQTINKERQCNQKENKENRMTGPVCQKVKQAHFTSCFMQFGKLLEAFTLFLVLTVFPVFSACALQHPLVNSYLQWTIKPHFNCRQNYLGLFSVFLYNLLI